MKRLIVAPHVDDDVLGCASVLDADAIVLYCGVDDFHVVSADQRLREALAVHTETGARILWPIPGLPGGLPSMHACTFYQTARVVNQYDERSLVADIELAITLEHPAEVYIPWPSYNQDHVAAYNAALVALRPHDRNFRVPRVLVYEGSQVNFWDWHNPGVQFHPNYFVPLDIERKLRLYRLMPSQVRAMRSETQLTALAQLRGGEIGETYGAVGDSDLDGYAEAFQILRWVGEAL